MNQMFMTRGAVQNAKGYEQQKNHLFITTMRNQHILDGIAEITKQNQER